MWLQRGPDPTGCWIGGYTFEYCCVAWGGHGEGIGNAVCWQEDFSYEKCCAARSGMTRDIFHCFDRGEQWQRFRRDMMLGRTLHTTEVQGIMLTSMDEHECLLGGLTAALVYLLLIAQGFPYTSIANEAFLHASQVFRTVLASPISFDEIISSGWPVGPMLATLKSTGWVEERINRNFGTAPYLTSDELQFATGVLNAFSRGIRAPLDAGLRFLLQQAFDLDGNGKKNLTDETNALAVTALWSSCYTLLSFDAPSAPRLEQTSIIAEARHLMRIGDAILRPMLLRENSALQPDPLSRILSFQSPILEVLQVLGFHAVVMVEPLSLMGRSIYFAGLPARLKLSQPLVQPSRAEMSSPPLLELHVLPRYDGVSNMVRATSQPFCYETAYLFTVTTMLQLRATSGDRQRASGVCNEETCQRDAYRNATIAFHRDLHMWEVGANLGDCLLWAVAILSGRATSSQPVAPQIHATAFEPLPHSAAAVRRSGEALQSRLRSITGDEETTMGDPTPLDVDIHVHEMALGEIGGTQKIGVPRSSFAESTFQGCLQRYGVGHLAPGCDFYTVETQTVDSILLRGLSKDEFGEQEYEGPPLIDLMKVHVQGDELRVLRGARRSLDNGRICVLLLKISSIGMAGDDLGLHGAGVSDAAVSRYHVMGRELASLLSGFAGALIASNGTVWIPFRSPETSSIFAWHIEKSRRKKIPEDWAEHGDKDRLKESPFEQLVAWHAGLRCAGRPALMAVRKLWEARKGSGHSFDW